MGIQVNTYDNFNNIFQHKSVVGNIYGTKIALWQLPKGIKHDIASKYDEDNNNWLESNNNNYEQEINNFENEQTYNLDQFKIQTKTTSYSDLSYDVKSTFPNGNRVTEHHGINYVFVNIKDKFNRPIAEKIYNYSEDKGRKIIYKNIEKDGNILTIARIYMYNSSLDSATDRLEDVVDFGYANSEQDFVQDGKLEKEYYMLNGQEVKVRKENNKYTVQDINGKTIVFTAK